MKIKNIFIVFLLLIFSACGVKNNNLNASIENASVKNIILNFYGGKGEGQLFSFSSKENETKDYGQLNVSKNNPYVYARSEIQSDQDLSNLKVKFLINSINVESLSSSNFYCVGDNSGKIETYYDSSKGFDFKKISEDFIEVTCPIVFKNNSDKKNGNISLVVHSKTDKVNLKKEKQSGNVTVTGFVFDKNNIQSGILDIVDGKDTIGFYVSKDIDVVAFKSVSDLGSKNRREDTIKNNSTTSKEREVKQFIEIADGGSFSFDIGGEGVDSPYVKIEDLYLLQNVDMSSLKIEDDSSIEGTYNYFIKNNSSSCKWVNVQSGEKLGLYRFDCILSKEDFQKLVKEKNNLSVAAFLREDEDYGGIFSALTIKPCSDENCSNSISESDILNNSSGAHIHINRSRNNLTQDNNATDIGVHECFTIKKGDNNCASNDKENSRHINNIKDGETVNTDMNFYIKKEGDVPALNSKLKIIVINNNLEYEKITGSSAKIISLSGVKNSCNIEKLSKTEVGTEIYSIDCELENVFDSKNIILSFDDNFSIKNGKDFGNMIFWPVVVPDGNKNLNLHRGIGHGSTVNVFKDNVFDVQVEKSARNYEKKNWKGEDYHEFEHSVSAYNDQKVEYTLRYRNNFGDISGKNIKIHDVYYNLNADYVNVNLHAKNFYDGKLETINGFGKMAKLSYSSNKEGGVDSSIDFTSDKDKWGWHSLYNVLSDNKNKYCGQTNNKPYCHLIYADTGFKKTKNARNALIINYTFLEVDGDVNPLNNFSFNEVVINPDKPLIYPNGNKVVKVDNDEKNVPIVCYDNNSGGNCGDIINATTSEQELPSNISPLENIVYTGELHSKSVINTLFTVINTDGTTVDPNQNEVSVVKYENNSIQEIENYLEGGQVKFSSDGIYGAKIKSKTRDNQTIVSKTIWFDVKAKNGSTRGSGTTTLFKTKKINGDAINKENIKAYGESSTQMSSGGNEYYIHVVNCIKNNQDVISCNNIPSFKDENNNIIDFQFYSSKQGGDIEFDYNSTNNSSDFKVLLKDGEEYTNEGDNKIYYMSLVDSNSVLFKDNFKFLFKIILSQEGDQCVQQVACGIKNNQLYDYTTVCKLNDDGAQYYDSYACNETSDCDKKSKKEVCGVDNITYDNLCYLNIAGTSFKNFGQCSNENECPQVIVCGNNNGQPETYSNSCNRDNAGATPYYNFSCDKNTSCDDIPEGDEYKVCSKSGTTYDNLCKLNKDGAEFDKFGECSGGSSPTGFSFDGVNSIDININRNGQEKLTAIQDGDRYISENPCPEETNICDYWIYPLSQMKLFASNIKNQINVNHSNPDFITSVFKQSSDDIIKILKENFEYEKNDTQAIYYLAIKNDQNEILKYNGKDFYIKVIRELKGDDGGNPPPTDDFPEQDALFSGDKNIKTIDDTIIKNKNLQEDNTISITTVDENISSGFKDNLYYYEIDHNADGYAKLPNLFDASNSLNKYLFVVGKKDIGSNAIIFNISYNKSADLSKIIKSEYKNGDFYYLIMIKDKEILKYKYDKDDETNEGIVFIKLKVNLDSSGKAPSNLTEEQQKLAIFSDFNCSNDTPDDLFTGIGQNKKYIILKKSDSSCTFSELKNLSSSHECAFSLNDAKDVNSIKIIGEDSSRVLAYTNNSTDDNNTCYYSDNNSGIMDNVQDRTCIDNNHSNVSNGSTIGDFINEERLTRLIFGDSGDINDSSSCVIDITL